MPYISFVCVIQILRTYGIKTLKTLKKTIASTLSYNNYYLLKRISGDFLLVVRVDYC
jgi:hypothetical protein